LFKSLGSGFTVYGHFANRPKASASVWHCCTRNLYCACASWPASSKR